MEVEDDGGGGKAMRDLPEEARRMIEEFICPGCVNSPGDCYEPLDGANVYGYGCARHVLGTFSFAGHFALGLPKGFNRPGSDDSGKTRHRMLVRLWPASEGRKPDWDHLNMPVWAMEKDGFLFVRTYMPRINQGAVDVIEGGTLDLVPGTIDVGSFIGDID
jgi:hypothetical protein